MLISSNINYLICGYCETLINEINVETDHRKKLLKIKIVYTGFVDLEKAFDNMKGKNVRNAEKSRN